MDSGDKAMKYLLLIVVVLLSGCIWRSANIDEYNTQGQLVKHTGIGELGILNINSRKGFVFETDAIKASVAESLNKPDPESIKTISEAIAETAAKYFNPAEVITGAVK